MVDGSWWMGLPVWKGRTWIYIRKSADQFIIHKQGFSHGSLWDLKTVVQKGWAFPTILGGFWGMESAFIKITLVKRHSTDAERSGYKVPWGESNKVQSFKELDICPESKHTKGSHRRQQYGNCAKFQGNKVIRTFWEALSDKSVLCPGIPSAQYNQNNSNPQG